MSDPVVIHLLPRRFVTMNAAVLRTLQVYFVPALYALLTLGFTSSMLGWLLPISYLAAAAIYQRVHALSLDEDRGAASVPA